MNIHYLCARPVAVPSRVDRPPHRPYTWKRLSQLPRVAANQKINRFRRAPSKDPDMTTENDIVLIYFEDQPLSFARIEAILPDSKPDWYHVKLLMLQIPLQVVTWILRDRYISGDEFTMNGKRIRLEPVVSPESAPEGEDVPQEAPGSKAPAGDKDRATVISLKDKRKR
jgi:hypothetical protein